MYKVYKNYKQRMEELEVKHNVKINLKILIISNIITAILVGVMVYNIQNKVLSKKIFVSEHKQENLGINKQFLDSKSISLDISKNLLELNPVLVNKLIKWLYVWQKVVPELNFSSFNKFEQKSLMIDSSLRYKLLEGEMKLRKNLYVFSPQKTKCIDPFYGRVILIDTKSGVDLKFDVSGMVLLINPETGSFQIVEMYGPSFDYDEAFWVNEEIFILAGSEIKYLDERPISYIRIPKISIYNLVENKVMSYYGFGIEEDIYQQSVKPNLLKLLQEKINI